MTYVAGKSVEELQRTFGVDDVVKLGSNENPLGPSPAAIRALQEEAFSMHRYPGVEGDDLRADIAARVDVHADQVAVGAGSAAILLTACEVLLQPQDHVVISRPNFKLYEIGAERAQAVIDWATPVGYGYDLEAMLELIGPRTRIVFLANPNNPTGLVVPRERLQRFADQVAESVLLVVDEAYVEFVDEDERADTLEWVRAGRNVLVTRTFSKVYGLAGLRVGYGIGPVELVSQIRAAQPPFHVGRQALRAARAALGDTDFLQRSRAHNAAGRRELTAGLMALGLFPLPSQSNHVLTVGLDNVDEIEARLNRKGVIARSTDASFGLPNGLRVTVGLPSENEAFLKALAEVLAELGVETARGGGTT